MQGKVECSVDNRECGGGNVWVLFYETSIVISSILIVEKTVISYGVNSRPSDLVYSGGAGISIRLYQGLGYDVQITISRCNFTHNVATVAAHLYLDIFSNCSVLVKDTSFTFANRIAEDDPLELVPVVHYKLAAVSFIINDHAAAIDVEIVLNTVYITENIGGGLCISRFTQSLHSFTKVWLKRIGIRHNFLVQDDLVHGYVFWLTKQRTYVGDVAYTSLESVEVSNNVVVFQDENRRIQEPFDVESNICALSVLNTEVHFEHTGFYNNSIPAVFGYNSNLHFHGVNVFKNNTGRQYGGALVLIMDSHIYLHRGTQVYILGNTALKYGGGICVDGGLVPEIFDVCFYQIVDLDILSNYDTFVYLEGNIAPETGYEIYAGTVLNCLTLINSKEQMYPENITSVSHAIFARVFLFGFLNISHSVWYRVSSQPYMICFCYQGPAFTCTCGESVVPSINVYPGQTFKITAVGMGRGISPAVVRSRINAKYDIIPELQQLGNACEPLNYTILAAENISGIHVQLTVEGSYLQFNLIRYLNVSTLMCPQGFVSQQLQCKCHPILQRASVQCNINTQEFTRSGSVWIGMGSDEEGLLTHMHYPNAYCKLQETKTNLTSPDVQCAFGHSGVLCGGCESGLSLMLGSSKCQHCSNKYLLLILPFLAAGVLLVIILSRLDITVASGTMNGVLFYANVVKASSDALISNSVSKYFMILSAWLNLDLGIETCFASHLDMFWKVLLQFAFPLYIWLMVAAIILLSRYSTVAARA